MPLVAQRPPDPLLATAGPGIGAILSDLLAAPDLHSLARRLVAQAHALGFSAASVVWRSGDHADSAAECYPARPVSTQELELLASPGSAPASLEDGRVVLCFGQGGGYADGNADFSCNGGAILLCARLPPDPRWAPATIRALLAPVLQSLQQRYRLAEGIRRREHSEQLQSALFAIADMAASDIDMPVMLRQLHGIVGRFMYAENFYIAVYDETSDSLRFLYLVDTVDRVVRDPNEPVPMAEVERGLTWYLIRTGRAFRGSMEDLSRQVPGPMRDIGPDCYDWLGVPILSANSVRGVLVVQSYVERTRYSDEDQALLSFVGSHILTALDRKQAQEDLERRVIQRTQELTLEVQERQRSVRLQETLYRIAELSQTASSPEVFHAAVHRIVGEFMDSSNFYIAVLSDDGQFLRFPYFVDQSCEQPETRRLGRGITEYVLRSGKPLLVDMSSPVDSDRVRKLQAQGELTANGPISVAWLGVPLICGERTVGVLAVQSYTDGVGFTVRDQELLTFISYQVANGLERQAAAAALKLANAELEQRVAARTLELSQQIRVREQMEEQLKHQVLHDTLTGLPNRGYLRDHLLRSLARSERNPAHRFAVLFIDLDRFKVINDSVGHLIGDGLLQEVARRCSACVRTGPDMVARLGGDEFAIVMDDIHGVEDALRMAQRIIKALHEPVRVGGKELFTGASVGIALSSPHYSTPEDLLRDADIAMYRAKAGGNECHIEVFDERLRDQALELLEIESDLRNAIVRGEFEPYFQPIVRLHDAAIVGYEALMRWLHPTRGVLAPGAFLHVAEASGSLEAIDWQMFERTLRMVPSLLAPGQYVNLNFSPRHFRSGDLDRRLLALLDATGVQPQQVRLEVTEGTLMENPAQIGVLFERLREHGLLIALDDFGTGYSSLSYLHKFRLQTLKIDGSFVNDLTSAGHANSGAVVRAIMALSHSQSLEVVAEGIESEAQRQALLGLGCVLGQGYLFARPQSLETILQGRLETELEARD
jgi:diguanylate cyclase (GGDEF)-like protein